ncbi:MAG: GlsB/YeaQ/YmgE family stress response membrane protein [Bacteroidota bacterium]|nr:GlsB/YeaQ/YmgE family stress response membrane protein [Bacteroidota bacterium]
MGSIIWSIIIGGIAGALAKLFMPGKDPGGIIITIILGIAGSLLFTFLGRMVGWYDEGDSAGLIASILGAMVLLGIYRLIKGRGAARAIK